MNLLHEIAPHETQTAQGRYTYRLANRNSGLKEVWTLHRQGNKGVVHRAEVSGRIGQIALRQLTHFTVTNEYQPKVLEIEQHINENQAETQLVFQGDTVEQTINDNGRRSEQTVTLPTACGVFFPPVSGQGFILLNYDEAAGGRQTIPLLTVRMQPVDAPSLSVEVRDTDFELVGTEEIETLAGQFACRHFKRYEPTMTQDLWLDETGMVIQWAVPQSEIMQWEYLLTEYHRG